MPLKRWVIYTLHDPREPAEVRYVGVTHQKPGKRRKHHIGEARRGSNRTHSARWIRKLLQDRVKPVLTVIEEGAGDGWGQVETKWIERYRSLGARLTNITSGGEGGFTGGKHTNDALAKMSSASRERWQDPEYRSRVIGSMKKTYADPDSKEHRRATALRVQNRPDVKEKQREAQRRSWEDPEIRARRVSGLVTAQADPDVRAAHGARLQAMWADPLTREQRRAALRAGWARKRQAAT
jgi:hypothetical protein